MLMLAVLGLWSLTVWPLPGYAQRIDCREGKECTEADLEWALFRQPRGVGTKREVTLKVLFEHNSDVILPQYYSNVDELGKVLAQPQYATYRIQIEGHTDSIGSDRYNQALSEKRAESVRRYLLQHFPLQQDHLAAVGYGESKPIASNKTSEGRSKNRRVQVVNLGE
jgi:outer membrane protein OmpA-like peptidoglycan-associated protein